MSGLVLLVTNVLHPVNNRAVLLFLDGDVRHGRCRRGSVPIFFAGRKPNPTAEPNLVNRTAPALGPAAAGRDDESLTQRMHMPSRPRSRLKSPAGALNECRIGRLKKRIDPHRASEPVCRSFAGRLRACPLDLHFETSFSDCFL